MFERSVGKKPVPYIASSRTRTGGMHRREAGRGEMVERELVERHRDEGGVADRRSRTARPRRARRAPCRSARSPCARAARSRAAARRRGGARRRRPPLSPSGAESCGGFGTERERGVPLGLGGRELLLGLLELGLDRPQRLELLGRRLALELRLPAELVDPRDQRAPALVGGEQRVELAPRRPCARARRASARRPLVRP